MDVHERAQQTLDRVLRAYERDDRLTLTAEIQQLIVFAANQGYIDKRLHILIEPDDLGEGQMTKFLKAIQSAQANNWRKKLLTHSRIMHQWFRFNRIVREW